jgi:hypothetical protein
LHFAGRVNWRIGYTSATEPIEVAEAEWRDYQNRIRELDQLQRWLAEEMQRPEEPRRERSGVGRGVTRLDEGVARMTCIRQQLRELEARFVTIDPDYAPFAPPIEFQRILGMARQAEAVLAELRVTLDGTIVFLAGPEERVGC